MKSTQEKPSTKKYQILFGVCLFLLIGFYSRVQAVGIPLVIISDLDFSQYPTITFYLQSLDTEGVFMDGLTESDVRIVEDQNTLPAQSIEKIEPGIHWIAAVNAGPRLKDLAGGVYRFEKIRSHLLNWLQNQPSDSPNDYSFTTNTGVLATNNPQSSAWSEIFQAYQPKFELSQPNLVSLSQAIDLASSSQGTVPKKYAVLYITPMMPQEIRDQLPDIAERARQMGVQVDVWLVGAGTLKNTASESPFRRLAEITGGSYFFFSGVEDLPNPSDSLEKLRWLYQIQYQSRMKTTGIHHLKIAVLHATEWKDSNTLNYLFDVLPPNPIFFSPPSKIIRLPIPSENRKEEDKLEPESVEIQLLVEFPDQFKRELIYSRLFANDIQVARNTEEPFDRFQWDLTPYTENQTVLLKVDIQDEAGFSASTIEIPVQIIIETRNRTFFELISDYQGWIISAAILLTLFLLASAFYTVRGRGKLLFSRFAASKKSIDPLTETVKIKQVAPLLGSFMQGRKTVQSVSSEYDTPQTNAVLVRLDDWLEEIPLENLPLPVMDEVILGKDARRVQLILNDSSISNIHARIGFKAPDSYIIYDEGSIAGTWVNYAPISTLGANLFHGDIIQFGRLTYRFKINHPESKPVISILPYTIENE